LASGLCHAAKPGGNAGLTSSSLPPCIQIASYIRAELLTPNSYSFLSPRAFIFAGYPRLSVPIELRGDTSDRDAAPTPSATFTRPYYPSDRPSQSDFTRYQEPSVASLSRDSHSVRFRGTSDKLDRGQTRFAGHLTLLAEAPVPGSAPVAGSARDVAVGSVRQERAQKVDMDIEMDMQEETGGTEKGGESATPPREPSRLVPPAQKSLRTPQKSLHKSPQKAPPQKSPTKSPQKGKEPRILVCLV
jgi:hypothetical protein